MIVRVKNQPKILQDIEMMVCWMGENHFHQKENIPLSIRLKM